jgi:protein phosphatase methylesterase 1
MGVTTCAFDWRGHGGHYCENEQDLSEQTLITDTINVLLYLNQKFPEQTIILVGHSMGGSIATKTADKIMKEMQGHVLAKQV